MKKKLDIELFANELRGESVFFPPKDMQLAGEEAGEPREQEKQTEKLQKPSPTSPDSDSQDASMLARSHARKHASTSGDQEMITLVARKVKIIGKEVIYVRSTPDEKNQIKQIVSSYYEKNIKTSDNEIGRIAINFLLEDYKEHQEESLLVKILKKLYG